MLLLLLRKLGLSLFTLLVLSLISYQILLRDPLNHFDYAIPYWDYISSLLQGDFGMSYISGEALTKQILNVFPTTIYLCLSALLISLILGIPLGFLAVYQQKNFIGKILSFLSTLSLSIPVFWLALILIYYASLNQWQISAIGELHPIYHIEPLTGFLIVDILLSSTPDKLKMMQSALHHLALPTLILALPATLDIIRLVKIRAEFIIKQNYVQLAQTRGLSPFQIWRMHILRNTLMPLIPTMLQNIILIFAFAMLIENVLSWDGIGRWLINALNIQDYNAISAGIMTIGIFILFVDLCASFLMFVFDPFSKKGWYLK